jgi:hypothetical protein
LSDDSDIEEHPNIDKRSMIKCVQADLLSQTRVEIVNGIACTTGTDPEIPFLSLQLETP